MFCCPLELARVIQLYIIQFRRSWVLKQGLRLIHVPSLFDNMVSLISMCSSLEALYALRVLSKEARTDLGTGTTSAANANDATAHGHADDPPPAGNVSTRLAYSHVSMQQATASGERGTGKPRDGTDDNSNAFETALAASKAASVKLKAMAMTSSARGQRRDKKARSAAAEALLNVNDPPGEIKMGLGRAWIHVDLVIQTASTTKPITKRVEGHIQWCDFWSTYQVRLQLPLPMPVRFSTYYVMSPVQNHCPAVLS